MRYMLATITCSDLVDYSGRATGLEVRRVYSRHRSLFCAYLAQRRCAGLASCPVILTCAGNRLNSDDQEQLGAFQAGYRPIR